MDFEGIFFKDQQIIKSDFLRNIFKDREAAKLGFFQNVNFEGIFFKDRLTFIFIDIYLSFTEEDICKFIAQWTHIKFSVQNYFKLFIGKLWKPKAT